MLYFWDIDIETVYSTWNYLQMSLKVIGKVRLIASTLYQEIRKVGCTCFQTKNSLSDFKGVLQRTFFISTNERLMYKFYKTYNYFIFK